MWAVAGVLLGCGLLALLAGFHVGPHSHFAAAVLGMAAAVWLVIMAFSGDSGAVLWSIFGVDLALSGGVAVLAWKGVQSLHAPSALPVARIEGAVGVVESMLDPDGLVNVRGETWSATSVNGDFPVGAEVHVIRANGVHLEVWGDEVDALWHDPSAIDHPPTG